MDNDAKLKSLNRDLDAMHPDYISIKQEISLVSEAMGVIGEIVSSKSESPRIFLPKWAALKKRNSRVMDRLDKWCRRLKCLEIRVEAIQDDTPEEQQAEIMETFRVLLDGSHRIQSTITPKEK